MGNSPYVIETTAERFEADVIERSKTTPVVLDFWAGWCQPCRRLGPVLEKLADEYAGKFILVKADTDQTPQQALAFRVEGIPAVFAVRDGAVVESFVGLLTESQLRDWLKIVVPSESEVLVQKAQSLEGVDPLSAERTYRQALDLDPQSALAITGLARVLLREGRIAAARTLVEQLAARGFLEPEAQRLEAELELRAGAVSPRTVASLRSEIEQSPGNSQLELDLAQALLAAGEYAEGLRRAVEVVRRERGPLRDEARLKMLSAFRVLGDESPLVSEFRRELALTLY